MKVFNITFLVVFCVFLFVVDLSKGEDGLDVDIDPVTASNLETSGEQPEELTTLSAEVSSEENTTLAPEKESESTESANNDRSCEKAGSSADPNDCRSYNTCSVDPDDGTLKLTKNQCRENEAFSENFNVCTRDITSCNIGPDCVFRGKSADPSSDTSYFWCIENYNTDGFRKFHVQCRTNEVFVPAYSDCVQDISLPFVPPIEVSDEELVKQDNKLLSRIEKERVKDEKRKKKEQEKLLKEEEKRKKKEEKAAQKAAEKAIKEQGKKNKEEGKPINCNEV